MHTSLTAASKRACWRRSSPTRASARSIHANEYQAIRRAHRRDARAIFALIQAGVENDELLQRTRAEIERQIDDFFVFEVDRNPVGLRRAASVSRRRRPSWPASASINALRKPGHRRQADALRRRRRPRSVGVAELFCLSTQAFNYFQQKGGFIAGTPDDLPPTRRERYDRSGRHSLVLRKKL